MGERAASAALFVVAYAACAVALRDPRQPMKPSVAKPTAIIAQVEGSGLATGVDDMSMVLAATSPLFPTSPI